MDIPRTLTPLAPFSSSASTSCFLYLTDGAGGGAASSALACSCCSCQKNIRSYRARECNRFQTNNAKGKNSNAFDNNKLKGAREGEDGEDEDEAEVEAGKESMGDRGLG